MVLIYDSFCCSFGYVVVAMLNLVRKSVQSTAVNSLPSRQFHDCYLLRFVLGSSRELCKTAAVKVPRFRLGGHGGAGNMHQSSTS
jgi:hypothetical protein